MNLAADEHRRLAARGAVSPVHAAEATYSDAIQLAIEVAPGGMNFLRGRALGPQFEHDLFMGAATPNLAGGYLFHFNLTGNRRCIGGSNRRVWLSFENDRVCSSATLHSPKR